MGRIYQLLRDRTAEEATALLGRIRSGIAPEAIVQQIDHGDLLVQMHLAPETNYRYEFPYLAYMPSMLLTRRNRYLRSFILGPPWQQPEPGNQRLGTANEPLPSSMETVYLKPYHNARIVEPTLDDA